MPRQTLLSRIFGSSALQTAGLVLVFLLLVVSFGRALWRDRDLRKEERQLESDLAREITEQERMRTMVEYLKSSDYIEAEARKTYGFAKPGEQVVVFQDSGNRIGDVDGSGGVSNTRKWYSYFFESGAQKPPAAEVK